MIWCEFERRLSDDVVLSIELTAEMARIGQTRMLAHGVNDSVVTLSAFTTHLPLRALLSEMLTGRGVQCGVWRLGDRCVGGGRRWQVGGVWWRGNRSRPVTRPDPTRIVDPVPTLTYNRWGLHQSPIWDRTGCICQPLASMPKIAERCLHFRGSSDSSGFWLHHNNYTWNKK